jgi:hypothetical protein
LPGFLLIYHDLREVELANKLIIPAIAGIATFLYVGLNIRGPYWEEEIETYLGPQIREALFELIPRDLGVSDSERDLLLRRETFRRLTGVFWEAIDRDQTLNAHKPHFYSNGFIYTTAIDVNLICSIGGMIYIIASAPTRDPHFIIVGVVLLLFAICSKLFVTPRARRRHQELSAEQLDLLRRNQADYVGRRFREIILERRRSVGH